MPTPEELSSGQEHNQEQTMPKNDKCLILKFEFDGKQYELANLTFSDTVNDLRAVVCAMLNIDDFKIINLKKLRPTRVIDHSENDLKLADIFSQSRERIVVERSKLSDYNDLFAKNIAASSATKSTSTQRLHQPTLKHHKADDNAANIPQNDVQSLATSLLAPLQQQQQPNRSSQASTTSDESPIRQRKMPREQQSPQLDQMPVCSSTGYFLRQPVPANNSCLFISVHYCLKNGVVDDQIGKSMRKIIAETVASDREKYDEAFLGKTNSEYCAWILDDNNWGGAIELSILCKYYETEIVAIDVKNLILNRFGEDSQYERRMLLLYDGLHYDPLKFQPFDENRPIITLFPIDNTEALKLGLQVAEELKQTHQFTDLNALTMICCTCDARLDAKSASEHAAKTGHKNFKEIH